MDSYDEHDINVAGLLLTGPQQYNLDCECNCGNKADIWVLATAPDIVFAVSYDEYRGLIDSGDGISIKNQSALHMRWLAQQDD